MDVVVVLAGIVEEAGILAVGLLDDLFQRQAFQTGILEEVVAVGHIGLVMLVVVKLERFSRHERRQRVVSIREGGQFEGHGEISFWQDRLRFGR